MRYGDVRFYNLLTFEGLDGFAPPNKSLSLNADYIWDFREAELEDYELYNARYMVAPTGMAVAPFLSPIQRTNRCTLYQAPTSGYAQFVAIGRRIAVPTQRALFESNLAWERGHVSGAPRSFIRYDYPASNLGPGPSGSPACPDGGHIDYERFRPGKLDLVVRCTAPAALILKMTYHPNWTVTVDGQPARAFMVSPSYIGIEVPAGVHQVNAVYEPTAIKTPLFVLGVIVLLGVLTFRRRLVFLTDRRAVQDGLGEATFGSGDDAWLGTRDVRLGSSRTAVVSSCVASSSLPWPRNSRPRLRCAAALSGWRLSTC